MVQCSVADVRRSAKKNRRMSGMSWIFIGLLVFFIGAAAFTALMAPVRKGYEHCASAPVVKSYIGVDEFNNTDQGVILMRERSRRTCGQGRSGRRRRDS